MGNFSRDPRSETVRGRDAGYVGLRFEQGVPILDRDLNLLGDLVTQTVREILQRHLGSGIAERNDTFAVQALPGENDFAILAPPEGGTCLVAGIQVMIDTTVRYRDQSGVQPLSTPTEGDRTDVVYLDVWIDEVDAAEDAALGNPDDLGMQTSVRLRPAWRVCVAEGADGVPAPEAGHAHYPLARIERRRGEAAIRSRMIVDLRRTGLHLGDLEQRVRRLEDLAFCPPLPAAPEGEAERSDERWSDDDRTRELNLMIPRREPTR